MKKKEINEKFEKLDEQIKNLQKGQEDFYEITQFILEAMKKYTDEPIFRITLSNAWYKSFCVKDNILQYVYKNKINEIATAKPILYAELFAYCDTHFILKNTSGKYFLVNMVEKTITDIPAQLLFSKEMNLTIEGQTLKICHAGSSVLGVCKHD